MLQLVFACLLILLVPQIIGTQELLHLRGQGEATQLIVDDTGLNIAFAPHGPRDPQAGILRIEEGTFVGGQWQRGRVLNGDQSHQGRHLRLPPGTIGIQRLELHQYR